MKKKFLSVVLTVLAMLMCIFGFSACNKVEFKVNFVVDGAVYSTLNTNGEEIIKMPENPTKEDYTFDGWYWDKDTWQTPFTANSLLDAPLSSDMNVYCKWKANTVNVESISLDKTEISLHENDVTYLTATVLPENATDTSVVWESSNSTIATVVGGKVTALRVGSATITVTTKDGGKIAACAVYVEPITVESVALNHTALSLLHGESKTLAATVLPSNATEKGVLWHSSNSSIASVENGTVKAVGYGTATITVTTVDGNKKATCSVEVIEDKITFNTLAVDGENVYGKVSNATTTFSFIREITEHGNATYQVYKEITCETLIASKSISLIEGDNTVYVLQTVGKDLKLYTVTVRRRPMYDVIFNANGGTSVEKQVIEEDYLATEPTTTRVGYTFTEWDYDFTKPITQDTTVNASWTANTNTRYKVEYYLQNLENDEYTLHETVNKTGTTDTTANAEIKAFSHFTHIASETDSGNIDGDGSQVLKVYYTRDKYTVTFAGNGGTLVAGAESQTVKYGGNVIAPTYQRTGYTFTGYDKPGFANISESITVTAKWKVNQYTLMIVYGNGQADKIITQDYNTKVESIAEPERAGYDFIGWDKTIPTQMPAEKVTITAKWQSIFTLSNGTITGLTDYGKANYTELDIPFEIDGVEITSIGDDAFSDCSSLTSVTIPDSVTSIGNRAFDGCYSLTSVYISSIEAWCNISFGNFFANPMYYAENLYLNNELVTEIVIPNTVTKIKSYAFYSCYYLKSVTIGNSVMSIGDYAFANCYGLRNIELPDSVTSIGDSAFEDCDRLSSVTMGNSVMSIGDYAFANCYDLTNIELPDSVTSIGDYAFEECATLGKIVIPESVTSMGGWVFYGCEWLGTIYCEAKREPINWSNSWDVESEDFVFSPGGSNYYFQSYYHTVVWGYQKEN